MNLAGVAFRSVMHSCSRMEPATDRPLDVAGRVIEILERVFAAEREAGRPLRFSHFVMTTTCPDRVCPSLGQVIQAHFPQILGHTPTHDLVQGCAGGVTNLVLAAELAAAGKGRVLFVACDTASRSVSNQSEMKNGFSDGAFACVVEPSPEAGRGLMKHCIKQFPDVRDVVLVGVGHVSRSLVQQYPDQPEQLEEEIGLRFDRRKAMKLVDHARGFIRDFFADEPRPDYLILHQVSPRILEDVQRKVFPGFEGFINMTQEVGNCGSASVGVVLSLNWEKVRGKKVFLCSFGTGGVISGSLWQL